jgi:predicted RNA-binding Zn ribbon-like protein
VKIIYPRVLATIETVSTKQQAAFRFDLTGGHLALDLANTVSRRDDPARRKEHLESFTDLLSFALQDRILSPKQANDLQRHARQRESDAERSFRKAIELREAVYRVFAAAAKGRPAPAEDLKRTNESALEALQHRSLTRRNGSYHWEWQVEGKNPLDRVLWPIAQSAVDLLTSDELKLVRWCEASDCEWLFLDHSRNRSRRWCDMNSCGNRAKARRHYQRTHE